MKCATHPEVETNLRCGKCDKPICPRCMVQTPVGARCPDCARLHKIPTYSISTGYYLRAAGTAFGMAVACGLLWGLIKLFIPFFYLNFLLAAGAGYAIGEVVSRAVNRKRGRGLVIIGGVAVAISYVISLTFHSAFPFLTFNILFLLIDLAALAVGIFVVATSLR